MKYNPVHVYHNDIENYGRQSCKTENICMPTVILHLTKFVRCRITIPLQLFSVLQLCLL